MFAEIFLFLSKCTVKKILKNYQIYLVNLEVYTDEQLNKET